MISKVLAASQAACSAPAPPCCLPVTQRSSAVSVQYLRLAGALHRACALFTNNVAYAFQLAGYTCAIIAFPVINISDNYELWVIAQSRVCEVIVGSLRRANDDDPASTSDGSNLLTALKTMHARLLEHASLLWVPETTDAIRTAHESVIGQILTMNLLRIRPSGATTVSVGRILC